MSADKKIGRPRNTEEKFWQRVAWQDPRFCWRWYGSGLNGYGQFWEGRVRHYSHRYAWSTINGPVPDGMVIMHICNDKLCCNPLHLRLGSTAENTRDAYDDGLIKLRRGERHQHAKLTEAQVRSIRADPRPLSQIASEYGIGVMTASNIKNRKTWRHL